MRLTARLQSSLSGQGGSALSRLQEAVLRDPLASPLVPLLSLMVDIGGHLLAVLDDKVRACLGAWACACARVCVCSYHPPPAAFHNTRSDFH